MITFHSTSSNPRLLLKYLVQSARLNQPCELCVSDFAAILKPLAFKHFTKAFIFVGCASLHPTYITLASMESWWEYIYCTRNHLYISMVLAWGNTRMIYFLEDTPLDQTVILETHKIHQKYSSILVSK